MTLPGLNRESVMWLDFTNAGFDAEKLTLLTDEIDEFESLFDCSVRLGQRGSSEGAWIVQVRNTTSPPSLSWDVETLTLTSYAHGPQETLATMQLLHTLIRNPERPVELREPTSTAEAARCVRDEILGSYPYFNLRGIDREEWVGDRLEHVPADWQSFTYWAQEWVAELSDAHTAVLAEWERGFNPPYIGSLTGNGLELIEVPKNSAAYAAGVDPGWVVEVISIRRWLRTTGATPQQHAQVAARRALTIPHGAREFVARRPQNGQVAKWIERDVTPELDDILTVDHPQEGVVSVGLKEFRRGIGIEEAFDQLCSEATPNDHMVLDLRGNTGGNLVLATGLRARFLRERTKIGLIAFSTGRGTLARAIPRWCEPSTSPSWPGTLQVQVDCMTYSAAEDFVLGLQGLAHVAVVGARTGGGSGRVRSIPLGPGLTLRISTAITYDRDGHPVEYRGIIPDQ